MSNPNALFHTAIVDNNKRFESAATDGAAQVARAPPFPRAPVCAKRRRGTGTPPFSPPSLHVEQGPEHRPRLRPCCLANGGCAGRHAPRLRAQWGRDRYPPPASLVHARTIRTRDKPPPPPLPFARKGGEAQERGAARDRTRDAGRRGGTRAHRPFPPLTGDRARNARGGAAAPLPWFARRADTQTRGARGDESGCAPHTLSAPPPFARTGGALQPGAAPPSPRVGARGERTEAAPPPLCIRHKGKRTGGSLGPRAAPPFPGSRARVNANGRRRGTPPLPWVRAQRRTQTGSHAEAPPSPGFARQGETPRGEPPSRVCALGTRGPGGA
ncbi:hypothetical protein EDB85DRAFT_2289278 [Lactarius pseudohatsudake]|nr:hypothetical protein EDB85DRAFT_2289278 [Lactarius pseudohatsudake]